MHEGVVDASWIDRKPQWAERRGWPISFALVFQQKKERRLGRRAVLKTGAIAGTGAAAALVVPQLGGAPRLSARNTMTLRVIADPGALDFVPSNFPGQGPFYIPGEIFVPGTNDKIGDFHCWGFFVQGGAIGVVSQEYDLAGRGKIQVQGVEDEGPRAVTGGTGEFRNVRGEMTGADLSNFPDFAVTFALIGG
jgi:hypothetical protein